MNFGRQDGLERRRVIVGSNQSAGGLRRRYDVAGEVRRVEEQRLVELSEVVGQLDGGYDWRVGREVHRRLDDAASDDEVDVGSRLSEHGRHLLRAHATHVDLTDLQQVIAAVQPAVLQR